MLAVRPWPACPEHLRRGGLWQAIVQLHNAAQVSPLADWPHGYPAWRVEGVEALTSAIAERALKRREA